VTWDEGRSTNHIPTIMTGQMIKRGRYIQHINHFNILATIESMYGLPRLGGTEGAAGPIRRAFRQPVSNPITPAALSTPTTHKREPSDVLT